jgi:hypothetical protein
MAEIHFNRFLTQVEHPLKSSIVRFRDVIRLGGNKVYVSADTQLEPWVNTLALEVLLRQ